LTTSKYFFIFFYYDRNYVNIGTNILQAVGIEFLITMVLVLTVFAAAADENNAGNVKGSAPLAIGLSITTCHLFAIPFTGNLRRCQCSSQLENSFAVFRIRIRIHMFLGLPDPSISKQK
jgi:hypothetical protein